MVDSFIVIHFSFVIEGFEFKFESVIFSFRDHSEAEQLKIFRFGFQYLIHFISYSRIIKTFLWE